ncbi:hypothetical protein KAH94_06480 [bacterium]|nr:hypothetical protein [bacterium]
MSMWWTPEDQLFAKFLNSIKYSIVADLVAGLPDSFDNHSPLRDVENSYTEFQYGNLISSNGFLLQAIRKIYNFFIGDAMIYSDRGDPAVFDFTLPDFTTDGTWRDLDLSAIAPANTKAVIVKITAQAATVNYTINFRKKGNTNEINTGKFTLPVKDAPTSTELIVPCNDDRIIQYNAENGAFDLINFVIKGWFVL